MHSGALDVSQPHFGGREFVFLPMRIPSSSPGLFLSVFPSR